jgi:hypothetical protein
VDLQFQTLVATYPYITLKPDALSALDASDSAAAGVAQALAEHGLFATGGEAAHSGPEANPGPDAPTTTTVHTN